MIDYSMEYPVAEHDFWSGFCDLDFVMAHKVISVPRYASQLAGRYKRTLIVDNGMHELGQSISPLMIAHAAQQCKADFVIPPDSLDADAYEWNMQQFADMCALRSTIKASWGIAVVLHGESAARRQNVLNHSFNMAKHHGFELMLCLPYKKPRLSWYVEDSDLRTLIHDDTVRRVSRIHLLGVNTLEELGQFYKHSLRDRGITWSVDTAKAYKWGFSGKLLSELETVRNCPVTSEGLLDYTYTPSSELRKIIQNIHTIKAVCQGR